MAYGIVHLFKGGTKGRARRAASLANMLLELLVQPELLEEGALLAPDLVRNVGRLPPVFVGEDVRRVAVLQQCTDGDSR